MKRINLHVLPVIALIGGSFLFSCKKDTTAPAKSDIFPVPISNMISQSMVDSLRAAGSSIYSGTIPPIVNGIYLMQPDSCIFDNSPGNFAGTLFVDYKFRFTNQNNSSFTLNVDQKNLFNGNLSSTPASVYISGNGSNFSIFVLRTITPSGLAVEQYNVLSGTLTANGIQNFQNVLYVRSKGSDPSNSYPPAGTIRIFVNGAPGLAVNSTTF